MDIKKSFKILEALNSLQKENLTEKEFNAKYPNIEYEKILSLKERIRKNNDIGHTIIKFHNQGILVNFIEKVDIKELPENFSSLENIHNEKYFDILSEIKDYELFFEVYKNINFKEFDSINQDELIKMLNNHQLDDIPSHNIKSSNLWKEYNLLKENLKSIDTGIEEYKHLLEETDFAYNNEKDLNKLNPNEKIRVLIGNLYFLYLHMTSEIKENFINCKENINLLKENIPFKEYKNGEEIKKSIDNYVNTCEIYFKRNFYIKNLDKIANEIIDKITKINPNTKDEEDKKLRTLINQKLDKFFNQSKLNKERTIQSIQYLFNNQIKNDNLREKFFELDKEILDILLKKPVYLQYLDKSIIEEFLSISKKDILNKLFPDPNNRKKEDIISYVNELWIKEISPDIDNEKLNILKNYEDLYTLKDFLREKFFELDYEILKIILNPDFYFHDLDESIIEKFLSISKEDILNKLFPDSNNRKKEDIISYLNELWIKEIKPDIDNEKLNILKNYEYLYQLKDFLREIIDFQLDRIKKLFFKDSLDYRYVFENNEDLLRYYIFELDIKDADNPYHEFRLLIFKELNKNFILNFELNKKILDNLEKLNNFSEDQISGLLKELIQFPGLADKFLDLDKDLIEKYVKVFSKTLFYDDLIKIINNEQKDPLDIFMKKYYLLDLLLSSKELLESAYKEYTKPKVEYCKQLSNISDLLIDFQPNNQELLNALRKFLPNLSEDEFNRCELVDQLFDFLSEKNLESTEYPNSRRFKINDKQIPSINTLNIK